jgi:RNAse (barnase) inhibitor barstar
VNVHLKAIAERQSDVYLLHEVFGEGELEAAAEQHGYRFILIECSRIRSKSGLLKRFGAALEFPGYFGHNWDALLDMLRDLSWLPADGYVIFIRGLGQLRAHDPATYETALAVLRDAAEFWGKMMNNQRPMLIFVA